MNIETWKPVAGYEGLYQVSDQGRVRSLARIDRLGRQWPERILAPGKNRRDGYFNVKLSRNGVVRQHYIHHLVAESFLGPRPAGLVVDHRDSNPRNNAASNLRYVTVKENSLTDHAISLRCPRCLNTVVQQFKKTGELVATYESTQEAERATGVHQGNICDVINGRRGLKSAGGFVWRRVGKQTGGSK